MAEASVAAAADVKATDNVNLRMLITNGKNPRGIPSTIFLVREEERSNLHCLKGIYVTLVNVDFRKKLRTF
jgi:hypothetical protein